MRYDSARAHNGDVLLSSPNGKTCLIDRNGNVLHVWSCGGFPARMLNPASTGGVKGEIGVQTSLVAAGGRAGAIGPVPGEKGPLADLTCGHVNWQGGMLWRWGTQAPGGAVLGHQDWQRLPNGDTLILGNRVTRLQGLDKRLMLDPVMIYEVCPTRVDRLELQVPAAPERPGVQRRAAAADGARRAGGITCT